MAVYFANGRQTFDSSCWTITTSTGGSLPTSTIYLSLQGQNRIGKNEALISSAITIPANGKITITINSNAKADGEDWHYFVIGASLSTTPNSFVQIAKIANLNPIDQITQIPFPLTLVLTNPEHIKLNESVSILPTTNLINGMLRGFNTTSLIYEYDDFDTTSESDGLLILDAPNNKKWKAKGSFSSYISNFTGSNGCRQDVSEIEDDDAIIPVYTALGQESIPVKLWLVNDSGSSVDAGTRITLSMFLGELNKSQLFDGKIRLEFEGFVNLTTGILRTTMTLDDGSIIVMPSISSEKIYSANKPNLILDDDLPVGFAYSFKMSLLFSAYELAGFLPEGSFIRTLPSFTTSSGVYNESGSIFGDLIFKDYDKRQIVTDEGLLAKALSGSGMIKSYSFPYKKESIISGFLPNTENQKVGITNNGECFYSIGDIPSNAALRAIIGTKNGQGKVSKWSSITPVNNLGSLKLTLYYPSDDNGFGTVRSDYPDSIAGNTKARFNPTGVIIYVQKQSTGQIRSFSGYSITNISSQEVFVSNWNNGTIVTTLPSDPNINFGLFEPIKCDAIAEGIGDFTVDNYIACFAFTYTNTITSISHSTELGCIRESLFSYSEIEQKLQDRDNDFYLINLQYINNWA